MTRERIKIRIPADEPTPPEAPRLKNYDLELPPPALLDIGCTKFLEYARRFWPAKNRDGTYTQIPFDIHNPLHLRIAVGEVYKAMRKADGEPNP